MILRLYSKADVFTFPFHKSLIMASTGTITLSGKSGKTYQFLMYVLNTSFKAMGGLYLFTKAADNTNYLLYLGHTQDLSSRFTNHHKEECVDNHGGTHVSVCIIEDEKTRIAAEKDILANYNFTCNEVNN